MAARKTPAPPATKLKLMQQRGALQALPDGTGAFASAHPSWGYRANAIRNRAEAYGNFTDALSLLLDA